MECIRTFVQLRKALPHPLVERLGGEVFPWACAAPPLEELIEQARREPQARIATGTRGAALLTSLQDQADAFRARPLEEALQGPFHLTLFDLGTLGKPGGALYEVIEAVYRPLLALWADQGIRWRRAFPILFASGPGCSTNYHWDPDDVLFWMLSGRKRFFALKEPRRWLTPEMLRRSQENPTDLSDRVRPAGLRERDILCFDMAPGEALWNPKEAPHWVDADDRPAASLSIAFTDLVVESSSENRMQII